MTLSFDHLPSGDVENDGWTFISSDATRFWEVIRDFDDDCFIICPQYRGGLSVSFPVDVTDLPAGAIIDSVTVFIRMKTQAGSGPRCVTVNLRPSTNRGRFSSRTVYADSDFTTYEVGTYTHTPLGERWTIHTLNHLELRVFSRNGLFDSVRISQLYAKVNFHTRPRVQVTSPSGTITSPSPTISWQYEQDQGEPQEEALIRMFTADQVEVATFNPRNEPPVFEERVSGEDNVILLSTSLNSDDYYTYIRVRSQFGAKSEWASKKFTVNAPTPAIPGDDNAGIAGTPGVGQPSVVADSFTSSAFIKMRDASNLLSVQQADFEIASDPLEYVGTNCTPGRSVSLSYAPGIASMFLQADTANVMSAESTLIEIVENAPLTARCQFRAGTTSRTVSLQLDFYDGGFTTVGTSTSDTGTASTGTWTEVVHNATSPAGARYAKLTLGPVGPVSNGEVHYVDHVGLMYGTDSAWSDGGHLSRNILTSHLATGDDPVSQVNTWVSDNAGTSVSQVSTSGTGSHGSKTTQLTSVSVPTSIAFRATGSVFTTPTSGVNYTLNKPAGVADNDLLVAFVTSDEHGDIIPPVGWDAVSTASVDDADGDVALWVLKKTGLAADPATWTDGEVVTSSTRRTAVVVAYSGAANASDQFIADGISTSESGELIHQTATVNNTDPNAWRIAAFAASDNTSGQAFSANEDPPQQGGDISYVGPSNHWRDESPDTTYKIRKPDNVQQGDLLIAAVSFGEQLDTNDVTLPSGWTLVNRQTQPTNTQEGGLSTFVMKKTAGSSEPNTWTGTSSITFHPALSQCVAYRGAADASVQFIDEAGSDRKNDYGINTPTVINDNSNAWRVCVFAALTPHGDSFDDFVTERRRRNDNTTSRSGVADVTVSFWDSDGSVSTGDHSRHGEIDGWNIYGITAWIGLIKPVSQTPAPGANETERVDNNNGSSNPWISTAVYDSNSTVGTGNTSLYGTFSGGTGNLADSMASWIGLIKPASPSIGGVVAAKPQNPIEISLIDPDVFRLCDNKITYVASFLGSSSGVPMLRLGFYTANQLITEVTEQGSSFDTSTWSKTWAEFSIPEGTTRIEPIIGAYSRDIGDTVSFDRVGVQLGGLQFDENGTPVEPTWRNGTSREQQPVWSIPVFQFSDDDGSGYGPYERLQGQSVNPPFYGPRSGELDYVDHTIVPLHNRRYRVKTISFGLDGEIFASGFGAPSEGAAFTELNWWLKDLRDLDRNMQLKVQAEPTAVGTTNTASVFQPLGAKYPVVVSEGYKADSVELTFIMKRDEHADLKRLLDSRRTLLLQTDVDHAWWVRPMGDLEAETQVTSKRSEDPLRFVKVSFVEVEPLD